MAKKHLTVDATVELVQTRFATFVVFELPEKTIMVDQRLLRGMTIKRYFNEVIYT